MALSAFRDGYESCNAVKAAPKRLPVPLLVMEIRIMSLSVVVSVEVRRKSSIQTLNNRHSFDLNWFVGGWRSVVLLHRKAFCLRVDSLISFQALDENLIQFRFLIDVSPDKVFSMHRGQCFRLCNDKLWWACLLFFTFLFQRSKNISNVSSSMFSMQMFDFFSRQSFQLEFVGIQLKLFNSYFNL